MLKFLKNKEAEILFMKNWMMEIADFYINAGDNNMLQLKLDLELYYQKKNYAGIKAGFNDINDINDIASDLPKEELTELNRRLKERFGKTLYDFQKNTDKKIAQILKRRKIRNEEEFRLAQMHIDRIFQDTEKEEEWKILEDLCFDFEQSVQVS